MALKTVLKVNVWCQKCQKKLLQSVCELQGEVKSYPSLFILVDLIKITSDKHLKLKRDESQNIYKCDDPKSGVH